MKKIIASLLLLFSLVLLGWNYAQNLTNSESSNKMDKKVGMEKRIKSGEDLTFFIATDTHYFSKKLTDNGTAYQKYVDAGDGKQLPYIDEIMESFVYDIEKNKPDFLIVSGDLTNNGEKDSHLDFSEKLKRIEKNGTSVYVIPGNHDISNPWARGFKEHQHYVTDTINESDFSRIYTDFGYAEAVKKDTETLSYLATPSEDVWLLMLDTSKYKDNEKLGYPQTDGELSSETLDWIKEISLLAKEKGATIITVMHHNLLHHSDVIQKGFTLNNHEETLQLFQENDLNTVLSGHIHIQDISSSTKGTVTTYDIATGSLAVNPHQYGELTFSAENKAFDYKTTDVDVEGWAKENGAKEHYLKIFKVYAEEYFGKFAYDMAYEQLNRENVYTETEVKSMAEAMKTLNVRYFAGKEQLNTNQLFEKNGYQLWSQSVNPFMKSYIKSISNDYDTNDNQLYIPLE